MRLSKDKEETYLSRDLFFIEPIKIFTISIKPKKVALAKDRASTSLINSTFNISRI